MRSSKGESGTASGFSTAVFTRAPCEHKVVETSKSAMTLSRSMAVALRKSGKECMLGQENRGNNVNQLKWIQIGEMCCPYMAVLT